MVAVSFQEGLDDEGHANAGDFSGAGNHAEGHPTAFDPPSVDDTDDGVVEDEKAGPVDDSLCHNERADARDKGTSQERYNAQRPAGPDHVLTKPLVTSYYDGHEGGAEIWDAGSHGADDGDVRIILELWELCIVILENTERDWKA